MTKTSDLPELDATDLHSHAEENNSSYNLDELLAEHAAVSKLIPDDPEWLNSPAIGEELI